MKPHHQIASAISPHKSRVICKAGCAATLGLALFASCLAAGPAETFDVDIQSPQFTLYSDPYNGNEIKLGGFSGLYPVPGKPNCFYTITDRGPAPDFVDAEKVAYKTWAIPAFGPHLVTLRLMANGTAKVEEIMPLKKPNGGQITGLPTSKPVGSAPYDFDLNLLPNDEDSLDAEGITIDPWGNFWVCEESKPSVAMIAPNGKVLLRLIPAGTLTGAEEVLTYDVLPAVLAKRRDNRGLEGITAAADGTLFAIMQRPLNNPTRAAADANGNSRLLAINLHTLLYGGTGPLVRQYVYPVPTASPMVTLSDLFSTAPGRMLVPERLTDKLFEIDIAGATDITPLETEDGKLIADPTKTLEQIAPANLATYGIVPVTKTVVLESMKAIDPLLDKVEGVCLVGNLIVLTYDNDFNVAEVASIPSNPNPSGPFVQLELIGANYPKIFTIPRP